MPLDVDGPVRTARIVVRLTGVAHPNLTSGPAEALVYVQWHNASSWQRLVRRLRSALSP